MTITYHANVIQGTDEWLAMRCGLLTASEMKLIVTPTLKRADNDKSRTHEWELLAQRITGHVEPSYISGDMLRGRDDEIEARQIYSKNYARVREVGFVTNDEWGFTIGCSPDGLVGDDGQVEAKSRRQKYQIQTIVENVVADTVHSDFVIQVQTALLVTRRDWCDFVSYSGGLHMAVIRVEPDPEIQDAIIAAASAFEARVAEKLEIYRNTLASTARLIPTERRVEQEMYL